MGTVSASMRAAPRGRTGALRGRRRRRSRWWLSLRGSREARRAALAVIQAADRRLLAGRGDRGHHLARSDAAVLSRAGIGAVGEHVADLARLHRLREPADADLRLAAGEPAERCDVRAVADDRARGALLARHADRAAAVL